MNFNTILVFAAILLHIGITVAFQLKVSKKSALSLAPQRRSQLSMSGESLLQRLDEWSTATLQIDGEAALSVAVDKFYEAVVADKDLERFFVGADMKTLRKHQFYFMRSAFSGGVFAYSQKPLDVAHARLFATGLDESHFDIVARHLIQTLAALAVPQPIIDDAAAAVAPLRKIFEDNAIRE